MATEREHALEVVDVLFELGHTYYDAGQIRKLRTLAGLSPGHHAYVIEIRAHFLQDALDQRGGRSMQRTVVGTEGSGEWSRRFAQPGRPGRQTGGKKVSREHAVEDQPAQVEAFGRQEPHEGLGFAHGYGFERAHNYEGGAPVGQKSLDFPGARHKTFRQRLEEY